MILSRELCALGAGYGGGFMKLGAFFAVGFGAGALVSLVPAHAAEPEPGFTYKLLQFEGADTFFTGIHDSIITGNYVIPGTTRTGGLLYDTQNGTWSAFPEATANNSNYPGATVSSPYGPGFGSQYGILRAVGSYQTTASAPYDIGYLYDAAAAPGQQLTALQYPSSTGAETLFTIAHSTFGNQVVGNYDTRLATGNAFIYDIKTGAYTTNNKPGAVSTTAYGIWGDKISGGYFEAAAGGGLGPQRGYIFDQTTGTFTTYDHPGAVATHFEGIVGAGRSGEYNLVTNWVSADGAVHAAVMHLAADGTVTWYEVDIPDGQTSSNSAYGDQVVGIYTKDGEIYAYIATLPGIYNPIRNTITRTSSAAFDVVLSGRKGDDIVNSGTIKVSGKDAIGMRGETYGVLKNSGTVVATGTLAAAVDLHGLYGTLLNTGTLQASANADAVRTGEDSYGTTIVNTGVIDGRIAATGGTDKRFENSGWLGSTDPATSITNLFRGTFVQTEVGILSLRVMDQKITDLFEVTGVARLAGTLQVPFLTSSLRNSYQLFRATDELTGTFTTLTTPGLPTFMGTALAYTDNDVTLNLTSQMARQKGLTINEAAVGAVADRAFNGAAGTNGGTSATGALSTLYGLTAAELPEALNALSGEAHASTQTVLLSDSVYARQAVLGRLRQASYGDQPTAMAALGTGGPALAYLGASAPAARPGSASAALAYATNADVPPPPATQGIAVWMQGFGGSTTLDGNANASSIDETVGGVMAGADVAVSGWRVGAALGYTHSSASMSSVSSSSDVDSVLLGVYGGTDLGPVSLRLGAVYAFNQIDTSRTILYPGFLQQADAQYGGGTTQVFGEVGYKGLSVQSLALEPFAGLAWVHLATDSFTESGMGSSGSAGLTGGASNADVGYGSLGLRAGTRIALSGDMALMPHASAAWQYTFGDLTPSTSLAFSTLAGSSFTVAGVPLAQNTAVVEAGLDLKFSPQGRIGVSYLGQFADGVTANAVQGTLSWNF